MVKNSFNINKANNHLSSQTFEDKKNRHMTWEIRLISLIMQIDSITNMKVLL